MAMAYKCDVCEKFFEEKREYRDLGIYIIKKHVETHADLCDTCYLNMKALFSGDAKIKRIRKENKQ